MKKLFWTLLLISPLVFGDPPQPFNALSFFPSLFNSAQTDSHGAYCGPSSTDWSANTDYPNLILYPSPSRPGAIAFKFTEALPDGVDIFCFVNGRMNDGNEGALSEVYGPFTLVGGLMPLDPSAHPAAPYGFEPETIE